MKFSDIPGQSYIKEQLLQSAEAGRMPHALLLSGKPGYGTLALALALCQYLQCENPQQHDSCGECEACKKNAKLIHPDVHFSFPLAGGKKKIKSDSLTAEAYLQEWRAAILKNPYLGLQEWLEEMGAEKQQGKITAAETRSILQHLGLRIGEGHYKIQLIWLAEKLYQEANRLLKVIEEPTDQTIFILVVENLDELLPTVISRVQTYKFPPLEDEAVASHLLGAYPNELTPEQAKNLALVSDGDVLEAMRLMGDHDHFSVWFQDWLNALLQLVLRGDLSAWEKIYQQIDLLTRFNLEQQKTCLKYGIRFLQQAFHQHYQTSVHSDQISSAWVKCADIHLTQRSVELMQQLHYQMERNANARIAFTAASFRWAREIHRSVNT